MTSESKYVEAVTPDSELWRKVSGSALLSHLDIELTERCNNDCLHCYINLPAGDASARERELSFDDLCSVVEQAVDLNCLSVRLTGGEPLLRPDFSEIYRYIIRKGMRVTIFTNGTLLSPAVADLLRRYPPFDLEVSVYGLTRRSYEAVTRRPGSFEAAMAGLELLRQRDLPFVVKGVALSTNIHEVPALRRWARELTGKEPGLAMRLNLRARRDGGEKRSRAIRSLRVRWDQMQEFLRSDEAWYRESMQPFIQTYLQRAPGGDRLFRCGSGLRVLNVSAYGGLQPCMLLRHPDCTYDLRAGDLRDALETFIPRLREARAEDAAYLARCVRCFLQPLCGQCPAWSWMEHGVLDRPVEYLCELAHAEAAFLGLLDEGEKGWERKPAKPS